MKPRRQWNLKEKSELLSEREKTKKNTFQFFVD